MRRAVRRRRDRGAAAAERCRAGGGSAAGAHLAAAHRTNEAVGHLRYNGRVSLRRAAAAAAPLLFETLLGRHQENERQSKLYNTFDQACSAAATAARSPHRVSCAKANLARSKKIASVSLPTMPNSGVGRMRLLATRRVAQGGCGEQTGVTGPGGSSKRLVII